MSLVFIDSVNGQRRPWLDCANAQFDQGMRCPHMLLKYVFLKVTYPIAVIKSATVKYVRSLLVKFLISGSLANEAKIANAPRIERQALIPLKARVQSGMVAVALPIIEVLVVFGSGIIVTIVPFRFLR